MEKFYMKLAERTIAVSANFATTKEFCGEYLLDEIPSEVDIEVNVTPEEIEITRKRVEQVMTESYTEAYLERCAVHRLVAQQLPKYGTVMFHGSAVALDGEVYLFTAPSGTGKSTHARLWREFFCERVCMVNDDKPFLHADEDGKVTVYGAPWDGKHHLSKNIALPLKGICILSQAKENKIERLSTKEAFAKIYMQTFRQMDSTCMMNETLKVLNSIMHYPVWELECDVSLEAVKLSYEAMSGNTMEEK